MVRIPRVVTAAILCAAFPLAAGFLLVPAAQRDAIAAPDSRKQLIAHRGASGSAPEHTLAAYQLALDQQADFVEPDLAVSKDGVLICLHDDSLERTTNVAALFPGRFRTDSTGQRAKRRWFANDFSLAELQQLDAGRWRGARFAGARIPTWEEMVSLVRGKAGLYPELKSPPFYARRGVDIVQLFVASVRKLGLDRPDSLRLTPLIVQSFDEPSIRRLAVELPTIPRVLLTKSDSDVSQERLREIATFATGIAPQKRIIERHPDMVRRAHALGLSVTSWTFRADERTAYRSVRDEMEHFLDALGIDALFTNDPHLFPRR
ncbi:MAG: glycerophosphodiester phosphodiesterase family protein [Synechococcaceae cyanobacterium]|nr:glycerophosphodiester phosphodiesterase family protein [Synechococcaceae cyanobacterium]